MEVLEPHSLGVVLNVRALPGARKAGLRGIRDGLLRVAVTQIAERGKANQALIQLLCKELGLRRSQIELLSGELAPQKRFLIREIALAELSGTIAESLAEDHDPA